MARRPVSRQHLVVHRLNQRTSGMRSRIYRMAENNTDNGFTETRDIGALPWTWDDFGFHNTPHYLHSTVRGFNQDYKELTTQYNLETKLQDVSDQLTKIIKSEIDVLRAVAERDKVECFGAPSASTPLVNTPYIEQLRSQTTPGNQNGLAIQQTLQEMKNASNWYTFESIVLQQLQKTYESNKTPETREQFYSAIVDYVWETWQKFINLPFEQFVTDEQDLAKIRAIIKQKQSTISRQKLMNWVHHKHVAKDTPFGFAKDLGLLYEDAIRQGVVDFAAARMSNIIVQRIGKKGGLVDVALHNPNHTATATVEIDNLDRFTGGVSAKLRANNKFSIAVSGTPTQFFEYVQEMTQIPMIEMLDALRYLYNNWMALSVFNTDMGRSYSNRKGRTRYKKGQTLIEGGHLMSRIFTILGRIINLMLISSGFFANAQDVGRGNICIFNPKYWETLTTQIKSGNMTIPAFLITANEAYETWQVVQYYLDNEVIAPSALFGTGGFLNTTNSYNASLLTKLYNAKAAALRANKYRLYSDLGLYDAIHLTIGQPLHAAFIDVFKTVLASNRQLSVKFRLIASDALQ